MSRLFASPGQQRVYDRIAQGSCSGVDIMRDCAIPVGSLGRHLKELQWAGVIIEIGKAPQAGRNDLRVDSPIWALRGTPLLPPMDILTKREQQYRSPHIRPLHKTKPGAKSGVIAERRQPCEFRELRRDPFEHRNLALLAR